MDVQKLIDKNEKAADTDETITDPDTGERYHRVLHFRNQGRRMLVGDMIGHEGRKYKITKSWGAGQDLFNYDAEVVQ